MRKILCLETWVWGYGCIMYCYSNLDAIYAKGLWVIFWNWSHYSYAWNEVINKSLNNTLLVYLYVILSAINASITIITPKLVQCIRETAWPCSSGCRIWSLEVPGSNPPPPCVNSQLVSLLPVGIVNSLCSIWSI